VPKTPLVPPPELVMGTAVNPLIRGDIPDVSVLRAGNAYYMVSTTMYFCPVAPVMKSYDLVNWRLVNYCTGILEDLPQSRLETGDESRIGEYGRTAPMPSPGRMKAKWC
jgi:beta-xylosidase